MTKRDNSKDMMTTEIKVDAEDATISVVDTNVIELDGDDILAKDKRFDISECTESEFDRADESAKLVKKPEIVLVDESGSLITEEEALEEEQRLLETVEAFFKYNPEAVSNIADEEEVEEEEEPEAEVDIVTINNKCEIVAINGDEGKEEAAAALVPAGCSLTDQAVIKHCINKRISECTTAYNNIKEQKEMFQVFANGEKMYDSVIDTYRQEISDLRNVLYKEPVLIENIKDLKAQEIIKKNITGYYQKIFDVIDELGS